MAQNFIAVDRDQAFLMPLSLREWLPENHLAWYVLDAVAEMDLSAFYGRYRPDGWGRPAYDPAMMVALLLYSYARGERSSRGIERKCVEDVAYRVIASNLAPDHVTINRFRFDPCVLCHRAGAQVPADVVRRLASRSLYDSSASARHRRARGDRVPRPISEGHHRRAEADHRRR
jgi:Transposase domain (DUF772)